MGLATSRAIAPVLPQTPRLVWPNDVVGHALPGAPEVPGWGEWRKLAGVLVQATSPGVGRTGIVLGVGINVTQTEGELPGEWAGSVATLGGGEVDRTDLAADLLTNMAQAYAQWLAGEVLWIRLVEMACLSVGRLIDVEFPDGERMRALGLGVSDAGTLLVYTSSGPRKVFAGDVRMVRMVSHPPNP
jgi:BirA family biotin operon repressor/biotin-[acetyl-CoA-carboxylase] ligase